MFLLKGSFYKDYAWKARGGGFADTVTDEGWELFAERLAVADKALAKAWELNPRDARIAETMITVELGQGQGRPRMEKWFNRAMDLNTNDYDACSSKFVYLAPKWYGTPEDLLAFGRECLKSKKWGGRVPLVLLDAHEALVKYEPESERANYWKRLEVWTDIKAAFENFFALNPKEIGWRHNYAWNAYRSEAWDDLNRQLPLLGEVNYEYFGGKDAYEKMVRLAKEHAKN